MCFPPSYWKIDDPLVEPFKGTIIHTASWKSRTKRMDGWLDGYEIRFDNTEVELIPTADTVRFITTE